MGGVEADIYSLEPEPKIISEAGAEEKWLGSATPDQRGGWVA